MAMVNEPPTNMMKRTSMMFFIAIPLFPSINFGLTHYPVMTALRSW
jgi:hypothetical protein